MSGTTQILAGYVAGLRFEDIPPNVAARARQLILDFAGNAVRVRCRAVSMPRIHEPVGGVLIGRPRCAR
jgi:2-methylcitrate dehydratase PrpD